MSRRMWVKAVLLFSGSLCAVGLGACLETTLQRVLVGGLL